MVGATGIEPVTPSMSTRCSPAELRAPHREVFTGAVRISAPKRAGKDAWPGVYEPLPGLWQPNQAASILFTSLTNSRRWTGFDSTFAFFGASESELSATAAKP